jgi:preflagellin peptidase FlaK
VPDQVWLLFYPAALAMITVRLIVQTDSWPLISLSIGSAVLVSLVLPYLRLWGGADAKAFICLAIMNPLVPVFDGGFLGIANPLFPLVVFSNAYIASLTSILYPVQSNLRTRPFNRLFDGLEGETRLRKIAAFLTGYRVSIRELESKSFLYLLESVNGHGPTARRRFNFDLGIDSNRERGLEEIKAAADSGLIGSTVWASPGLPFLLFITVGLLLSLLLGDVVWYGVSSAMQSTPRLG